jgi:hypothetical protein
LGASGIPFVGADALEHLAHAHLLGRRGMAMDRLQFRELFFADADDAFD